MNSVATVIPAKPSVNNQNDDKNGNSDDFDFSKMRMFDEGKVGNIWGKSDEDSAWGGLFSQFLPQLGANSSLNNSNSKNDSSNEWGQNEFISQLLINSSLPNATSSPQGASTISSAPVQQPSTSSVTTGLSSLELKGWMPASFAPSARDPNRSQPPLFARSQSNSVANSTSTNIQQQQQQQIQHLQQQQALQQQQQRIQQFQQQYQQHQSQSSQQPSDLMSSKFSMLQSQQQQQQLYNQMQSLGQDGQGSNLYNHLAAQLLTHQESSTGAPGPTSSQLANSYYPSPSYTDASVLGQISMPSLSQRGIKQFDGFNNDSDGVIAAILEQQQQQKKQGLAQQSFMHNSQQPQPFGAPSNASANQSRLGMIQPRPQPPPFVAPQAPPGFSSLGNASSTTNPSRTSMQQMYQQYGQSSQQQPYGQMPQAMDWNRLGQQQQSASGQQNHQSSSSNKWSSNW